MKTVIVYYSKHHGNTKKLLDVIAGADPTVVLIDVTAQPLPICPIMTESGLTPAFTIVLLQSRS